MAEHVWSVFCLKGVLDKYSNQVSIFDVVEEMAITFQKAPPPGEAADIEMSGMLVSFWTRSDRDVPETLKFRVTLHGPDDAELKTWPTLDVDLTTGRRSRGFIRVEKLLYVGPGVYRFHIQQGEPDGGWETIARVPFEITVHETATGPDVQPDAIAGP